MHIEGIQDRFAFTIKSIRGQIGEDNVEGDD